MEKIDYKKTVSVSDLGLAALLLTLGFKLLELKTDSPKSSDKRVYFIYLKNKGVEKIIDDFWVNVPLNVNIPIQILFANQKFLKNRIWEIKAHGHGIDE